MARGDPGEDRVNPNSAVANESDSVQPGEIQDYLAPDNKPSAQNVAAGFDVTHSTSDVDAHAYAQHHTLGGGANQASPGRHTHAGNDNSAPIPATSIQELAAGGTAYNPTWTCAATAPAIGNGTLAGRFTKLGQLCLVSIYWAPGSTTTYGTGSFQFDTPPGLRPISNVQVLPGYLNQAVGNLRWPIIGWLTNTQGIFRIIVASGKTEGQANGIDGTGWKAAWAVGDYMQFSGLYEWA